MRLFLSSATSLLYFAAHSDAFWRLNCGVVQTGRVDPLVNPGAVAAHCHTITGGSNIGVNATTANLTAGFAGSFNPIVNSKCTSCEVTADKSAYWTPLLYYWYPNGSFYEVPHGGSVVYYLGRGPNVTNTVPFPPGFGMLSGNKALRSYANGTGLMTYGTAEYPGRPVGDRISFACLTAGTEPPNEPYMYNATSCINGMRAQIAFQGCWNGIDLYTSDNSHVDYLSGIDNGICNPAFPYQIPLVFVETDYSVATVPLPLDGTPLNDSRFVFSQGDPTGYGFHGDFINGWDQEVLENATSNCLYSTVYGVDGVIQECPILNQYDSNGAAENCPEQPPQINETVHGLLPKLPGCINVVYGPAAATSEDMECNSTVTQPYITPTPMGSPLPTASPSIGAAYGNPGNVYLGCWNDTGPGGGYRALAEVELVNLTGMTVEVCQTFCASKGYRLSGVEYQSQCYCDNELNPTSMLASTNWSSINECTWICTGSITNGGTQEYCGGLGWINISNNTDPSFVANGSIADTAGEAQKWQPFGGYGTGYLGCYSDSPRQLTAASASWNNMSVEVCATFCANYQWYGVEYARECYCGTTIVNTTAVLPSTSCSYTCLGDSAEICGGSGTISIYNNTNFHLPGSETPTHVGQYGSDMCVSNTGSTTRALAALSTTNAANMTTELCVKFCLGNYYHYAGTEAGTTCYCDNSIVAGVTQSCSTAGTQVLCAGNKYEYCGGSTFMNLYYSSTL